MIYKEQGIYPGSYLSGNTLTQNLTSESSSVILLLHYNFSV
jgi:hypothetical protein